MFSLIIPTFNERENVAILIPLAVNILTPVTPFEIIVVDDDSPDKTWEVVEEIARKEPRVRLIRRFNEKDLSSAVIAGFEAARGELLGVMDADLQHDENLLPLMIDRSQDSSIVIASRYMEKGSLGQWSWSRTLIAKTAKLLPQLFLSVKLSDPLSGYFVIHREIFKKVGPLLNPRGFKILLEIISRSSDKNISEVPLQFRNRLHGTSKLNTGVIINYLLSFYDLFLGKYFPIKFLQFCTVGLIGVIVNLTVLYLIIQNKLLDQDPALLVAIIVSMIGNYFLNNFWTFEKYKFINFKQLMFGFLAFFLVCTIGSFINFSCAVILNEKVGVNIYFANLIGIGIASVWNFRLSENLIWKTSG